MNAPNGGGADDAQVHQAAFEDAIEHHFVTDNALAGTSRLAGLSDYTARGYTPIVF